MGADCSWRTPDQLLHKASIACPSTISLFAVYARNQSNRTPVFTCGQARQTLREPWPRIADHNRRYHHLYLEYNYPLPWSLRALSLGDLIGDMAGVFELVWLVMNTVIIPKQYTPGAERSRVPRHRAQTWDNSLIIKTMAVYSHPHFKGSDWHKLWLIGKDSVLILQLIGGRKVVSKYGRIPVFEQHSPEKHEVGCYPWKSYSWFWTPS